MFKEFETFFNIYNSKEEYVESSSDALTMFRNQYQGKDFCDGLYRVFGKEELPKWKEIITEGYLDFAEKFEPFAYDWLGICFALDLRNNTKNTILIFEIGTADVLEIPCNFVDFHNKEIPLYSEACLAATFFKEWNEVSRQKLEHNKCAGYKIPLFLGGEDTIANLEVSDMEVYWFICSSAKNKK